MRDEKLIELAAKCREASIGNYDWSDLLSDVTTWVGGDKALWLTGDAVGPYSYGLQQGHDPETLKLYNDGYNVLDPRRHQSRDTRPGQAVPGQRYLSNAAVEHSDYFQTINVGGDVKDSVFGVLCDDPVIGRHAISIQRGFREEFFDDGDAARFEALIPHLTEALRHSVAATRFVARHKLGDNGLFAFVDADRNLLHFGDDPAPILAQSGVLRIIAGQLVCSDPKIDAALAYALDRAISGQYICFRIPAGDDAQLAIEFTAVPEPAQWLIQDRPHVMMTLTREQEDYVQETRLFASVHGLSQKETRVLRAMLKSETPRDAARDAGISYETLRWHLKAIFQKTGYNRKEDMLEAVRQSLFS